MCCQVSDICANTLRFFQRCVCTKANTPSAMKWRTIPARRSHRGVKGDTNMFKHTLFHTLIAARLVVSHVHYKAHTPLSPRTGDSHMSPDLNSQPLHVLLTPGHHVCLINFICSWRWLHCVIWFESGAFVGVFCGRVLGVDVCPGVEGPSCCCWGVTAGISQSL